MNLIPLLSFALLLTGCGVKGDPLPPQRPSEIGRGRPTYRRATERVKVQSGLEETEEEGSGPEGKNE